MKRCSQCGKKGTNSEIKHAPNNLGKYSGKLVCYDCYKEIQGSIFSQNKKEVKVNNEKKTDMKACIYCGSSIHLDTKICPHCMYDYNKGKVLKREKTVKTNFKKVDSSNKHPIKFEDKVIIPKKIKFLSVIPVILIFIMIFLVANQYGLIATITNNSDNIDISGKYKLEDMKQSADDDFTQTWIFYENNHSLKIETEYNEDSSKIKPGESNKFVNYYNYIIDYDNKELYLSQDYSDYNMKKTFNIHPSYSYSFCKSGSTLKLKFEYMNFDLEMILTKI